MLLLLLLLHACYGVLYDTAHVTRKQTETHKNFTIKHIDSCPKIGYYVQRELAPNSLVPGPCFLCFCQQNSSATCWRREDWRCDAEHYHVGRRPTRIRRATGLSDIFFRDATRDVFNKNLPEQCKPFESSFSDGCPPVDWCIGCTVCDCDANGRWDCHVLSFCDPTTNKPPKRRKDSYRRNVIRKAHRKPKKPVTVQSTVKPPPKIIRKVIRKPAVLNTRSKRQPETQKNVNKRPAMNINRNQPKKIIKKKAAQKKIIKKAKSPVEVNNKSNQIVLPTTPKFAQAVVQKVLEAVQQLMRNDVMKGNTSKILNAVDKKRINVQKPEKKALVKRFSTIIRRGAKQIKTNDKHKNKARNKREVDDNEHLRVISVVPLFKVNTSISHEIIPIQRVETTTEKPSTNLATFTTKTETSTTTPQPTFIITEPAVYYEVTNEQTSTQTDTTSVTNITTVITDTSAAEIATSTKTTPNKKWKQIMSIANNTPDIKNATENIIQLLNNMTNANDLKFKKWYQIKLLKDREKYLKMEQFKGKDINMFNNNKKIKNDSFVHLKPNVYSQNIRRKIDMPKRNKMRKIIMSPRLRKDGLNATFLNNKVSTLQNIFKNILKEFDKNSTKIKNGKKKINIVKYMRNLFSNLLRKGKSNTTKSKTEIHLEKQHTINMLCENIGSCNIHPKDRRLLDAKVTQLGVETDKVLKIIKIIKGLLHLVEIPVDSQVRNTVTKAKPNLNNDVNKLNIILRDSYINDLKSDTLSQTQATQIDYIKKNTQEFIHTIANFGKILNEIISILKKNNKSVVKRKVNEIQDHQFSNSDAFQNLRNLLIRYDIVQNSYFKKIYDSLTKFEIKLNKDKQVKTSVDNELKNMKNIDNFSRNIVTNLRHLTQLAQNINSRTKREAMRDNDAIEYLLMLMEYLLKQNYSLDAAPANDGIDMLIEAIKNAPDIKPIRKKVLEYTPAIFPTRTVPAKIKKVKERMLTKTTTFKKPLVVTSRLDNPKFVEPVEEDRDYDDKYLYTRRAIDDDGEAENKATSVTSKTDTIPEYLKDSEPDPIGESKVENFAMYNNSDAKVDKSGSNDSVEEKKYDIFNADLADFIMFVTPTSPPTHAPSEKGTTEKMPDSTKTAGTSTENEVKKIEWIDESYEKDTKDMKEDKKQPSTKPPVAVTRTKKATSRTDDNISSITREIKDAPTKMRVTSAEDVAYKKQMDLLNSLDYVTEKTEFDIEPKDVEDNFPSYFG